MSEGKFGEGHVAAMGRLGLKELRNAMNPSRESVADNEIGLYGTLTQGEIAEARGGPGKGPDQERMGMAELRAAGAKEQAQAAERGKEQGHDQGNGRDHGMER